MWWLILQHWELRQGDDCDVGEGSQNVTVETAVFTGTENGLRIETWGRPSDSFVKGVVFEHSIMQNVENPIIIDQNYCHDDKGCQDQIWIQSSICQIQCLT